ESSLVRLALNALQADRTTNKIPSLWHRLSSTDALGQILRNIGCFGSLVFLLRKFIDHFTSLNLCMENEVPLPYKCRSSKDNLIGSFVTYYIVTNTDLDNFANIGGFISGFLEELMCIPT
ncbi:hypothetical protein EUTSA_v10029231mg, partial [Eutrema salsugineum]